MPTISRINKIPVGTNPVNISSLPSISSIDGTEYIPVVKNGVAMKAGNGRYLHPPAATIFMAAYGSKYKCADYICDGVTDVVKIKSALNDLKSFTYGGKLLLSEGLFNITENIPLTSLYGVLIEGMTPVGGWMSKNYNLLNRVGTVLRLGYNGDMFSMVNCCGLEFSRITFDGTCLTQANGLCTSSYIGHILDYSSSHNCGVNRCNFMNYSTAIYASSPWDHWTTNCNFTISSTVGHHAIHMKDTAAGWYIAGNRFEQLRGHAIFAEYLQGYNPCNSLIIEGNKFEFWNDNAYTPIKGAFYISKINSNTFQSDTPVTPYSAIELTTGSGGNTIVGNTINGFEAIPIKVTGSTNTINSNVIINGYTTSCGIELNGNLNTVVGNTIVGVTAKVTNNGSGNIIEHNA